MLNKNIEKISYKIVLDPLLYNNLTLAKRFFNKPYKYVRIQASNAAEKYDLEIIYLITDGEPNGGCVSTTPQSCVEEIGDYVQNEVHKQSSN